MYITTMRLLQIVFLLCALATSATAQTSKKCTTAFGTKSVKSVKTSSRTTTRSVTETVIRKVTPTKTVTPQAVTTTVRTTSTSTVRVAEPLTTNTRTEFKTTTITRTVPTTLRVTSTTTSWSTVLTSSTTTITAPAGFTALAEMQGFMPKRNAILDRLDAIGARAAAGPFEDLAARADAPQKSFPVISHAAVEERRDKEKRQRGGSSSIKQFKTSVLCQITTTRSFTTTRTSTVSSTVTKTASRKTARVTSTVVAETTSRTTLAPKTTTVTVPTTVETTSTSTSTTTTTETKTETRFAPSSTVIAQCKPQNIVSSAFGQQIGTISFNRAFLLQAVTAQDTTGYGCCAACATTKNCAGYGQYPGGDCYYIVTDGRCDASQSWDDKYHYYETEGPGYIIGNGQCGFMNPQQGDT